MKNLLIIDTETTGINIEDGHKVIEVGAVFYNVKHTSVMQCISTLLPVYINNAEHVNNIPADLSQCDMCDGDALDLIAGMAKRSDAIVAHNAEFDKKWMNSISLGLLDEMPWICSCHDFEFPGISMGRKLIEIAVHFNIPIVNAHRALSDCMLLAECFSKVPNLKEKLQVAMAPKSIYIANISYDERHKAKDNGFSWNSIIKGKWAKKMTDEQAKEIEFSITKND